MGSFSWRVNGVPPAAIGGLVVPAGGVSALALPADYNDTYLQKVTKVVPVEIVGAYTLALQIVPSFEESQRLGVLIGIFVAGFVLTIGTMMIGRGLYQPKKGPDGEVRRDRQELIQIVLALVAYVLWAYLQGGAFATGPLRAIPFLSKDFWPYSPGLGALAVIAFGVALNWFNPEKVIDQAA